MLSKYEYLTTNSELTHHGILGQKWGIRRFQNKDGSLTSAGKKRYGVGQSENKASAEESQFHLSDKQKKMLKVGAIAAGTALAAYGAYKIGSNPDVQSAVRRGIETLKGKSNAFSSEQLKEMGIEVTDIDRVDVDKINFDKDRFDGIEEAPREVYALFGKSDERGFNNNILSSVSSQNKNQHDCGPSSLALLENANTGAKLKAKDVSRGLTMNDVVNIHPSTKIHYFNGYEQDNFTHKDVNNRLRNDIEEGGNGLLTVFGKSEAPNHFLTYSKEQGNIVFRDPTFRIEGMNTKGVSFSIDNNHVELSNGLSLSGDKAKTFIDRYFGKYSFDLSTYIPIKGHTITNDTELLNEYFEPLK